MTLNVMNFPKSIRTLTHTFQRGNAQILENNNFEISSIEFTGFTSLDKPSWCRLRNDGRDALLMNDLQRNINITRSNPASNLSEFNIKSRRWLAQEFATPYPCKTVAVVNHAPLTRT
jgi:hypothetical protein